jgi:dephospho-CoA kinase
MLKAENRRIKLGVTGGIGSGKTSVCRVFSVLGVPLFSADQEAREIMGNDKSIMRRVNSIAGRDLYPDGSLDRMLLEKVNSLVHPVVFDHYMKWEKKQTTPYTIMEVAILFESGASLLVDRILTVVAPVEERINRIIERNQLSREQIQERIRNQWDDESRIKLSDYVIRNSDNEMIIPAVLEIHEELLNLYKQR